MMQHDFIIAISTFLFLMLLMIAMVVRKRNKLSKPNNNEKEMSNFKRAQLQRIVNHPNFFAQMHLMFNENAQTSWWLVPIQEPNIEQKYSRVFKLGCAIQNAKLEYDKSGFYVVNSGLRSNGLPVLDYKPHANNVELINEGANSDNPKMVLATLELPLSAHEMLMIHNNNYDGISVDELKEAYTQAFKVLKPRGL
ncbi:hypothetical protein [Vibrio parahaemolyticus]|uniref:hypothetical protein n=1 Tax=Vibrio parahaemolyticus TaxID=670 RepID=UPI00118010F6|nr:hypothetical protein [Vibrio parahaemolyticus]EKF6650565.1 hypothetical protein [Vibrio parahaemolyticus]